MSKRSYRPRGTGHVFPKGNTWYGEFYLRGRKVKRSLGPIREPGTRIGLTRTMAEKKLREQMTETAKAPPPVLDGRWTIADVGARRIAVLPARAASRTRLCLTPGPTSACTSRVLRGHPN